MTVRGSTWWAKKEGVRLESCQVCAGEGGDLPSSVGTNVRIFGIFSIVSLIFERILKLQIFAISVVNICILYTYF